MINDPTDLIFHFNTDAQNEVGAVKLGRLVDALEQLILSSSRHLGTTKATFLHIAAPARGSLKFCFRIAIEGELQLPPPRQELAKDARENRINIGTIAGVGALLAALFAPNGMYDVFHNGAKPSTDFRAVLASPLRKQPSSSAQSPERSELEDCLKEVSNAARDCGAERVEIQLPDHAPVQLLAPIKVPNATPQSSISGNWKLTIKTPMGAREMRLHVVESDNKFDAIVTSDMGNQNISGIIDGNTIKWSTAITSPMPMSLDFSAIVDGNYMTGNVKLGMFGNATLSGERIFEDLA